MPDLTDAEGRASDWLMNCSQADLRSQALDYLTLDRQAHELQVALDSERAKVARVRAERDGWAERGVAARGRVNWYLRPKAYMISWLVAVATLDHALADPGDDRA